MEEDKIYIIQINKNRYEVKNPIDVVRAFWLFDESFLKYDQAGMVDSMWEAKTLSRNIGVRTSDKDLDRCIDSEGKNVNNCLNKIKELIENSEIIDITEDNFPEVLDNMVKAIALMTQYKGISVSTSTKILHKRNPGIFPILDVARVQKTYGKIIEKYEVKNEHKIDEDKLRELIKAIRGNIKESRPILDHIKSNLPKEVDITKTRIFDILLWAESGEYDMNNPTKLDNWKPIPYYFFQIKNEG
jgi:predicted RNA binding protein with dsRBD fold (UPF0201 family)